MLWLAHRKIGKTIYQVVAEETSLHLDLRSLVYGCIKPDLMHFLITLPHYMDKSIPHILTMIENLHTQAFPMNDKERRHFSIRLGVVLHYLTDYYCQAHNHQRYQSKLAHFIYELRMDYRFNSICLLDRCRKIARMMHKVDIGSLESCKTMIERMHTLYLRGPQTMNTDIRYSMDICMLVTCSIIKVLNARPLNQTA